MDPQLRIEQLVSFGVEEEFVLVDARDRFTAPRGREVLEKVGGALAGRLTGELYAAQVETNTNPRMSLAELRADLAEGRQVVATAARDVGCRLVAAGSGILTSGPPQIIDDPRYEAMVRAYPRVLSAIDSEPSGCHIHLGTLDRAEALALSAHLRPWLPVFQAIAANSPYSANQDRGCASWRHFQQRHWHTVGPAPVLDEAGYERLVEGLIADGTILDRRMLSWYARPSEHLPTLEIRVADVNADLDITVLVAGLLRAMATTLLAELRAGRCHPEVSQRQLTVAHAAAARGGLTAVLTGLGNGQETVHSAIQRAVRRSLPGLRAAGDLEHVLPLLDRLRERGSGADRQRAAQRRSGSLRDVVDEVVVRIEEPC